MFMKMRGSDEHVWVPRGEARDPSARWLKQFVDRDITLLTLPPQRLKFACSYVRRRGVVSTCCCSRHLVTVLASAARCRVHMLLLVASGDSACVHWAGQTADICNIVCGRCLHSWQWDIWMFLKMVGGFLLGGSLHHPKRVPEKPHGQLDKQLEMSLRGCRESLVTGPWRAVLMSPCLR